MSGPESVFPPGASSGMSDILLRTPCCKISLPLTLLFGKVFFRIHFALGLEGLPVPIERKPRLDPCLVGPPYGLELPLAPLQHRDVLLAGAQYGRRPHLADLRRAPGRHELRGVLGPPDLVRAHQRPVRLPGHVALEAPHDLPVALPPRPGPLGVLGGLGVAHDPLPRDLVQRAVRLPVAAPVEPVPHGLAARGGDGAGPAYRRERRLGAQPARVVPGRDRELGRAHGPAPVHRQQRGAVLLQGRLDRELHVERRVARRRPQVRQRAERGAQRALGAHGGELLHQPRPSHAAEPRPEPLRRGGEQRPRGVDRRGPRLHRPGARREHAAHPVDPPVLALGGPEP